VVVRMALEIFCFRSLFRNTKASISDGSRLTYEMEKWLWLGAIAFHYSFLVVLIRHLRFFTEPVPFWVNLTANLDGFLEVGLPGVMISGVLLLAAAVYLLLRRMLIPQMKYISLASDFFPLFLIMGIAVSGIVMRYFSKTDVTAAKELALGLVTFQPTVPAGVGSIFYIHLFFVSVLLAYFPFSKLMHLGGIFLSPTRNTLANTRQYRHVNPWNYPVKVHTYSEYEDEFREKMIEAGLPVEKE
jgi:nitrate reductase gamma subunit